MEAKMRTRTPLPVTIHLTFDRSYANNALVVEDYSDWETIKRFLDVLGYDVKFVHVTFLTDTAPAEKECRLFPTAMSVSTTAEALRIGLAAASSRPAGTGSSELNVCFGFH